MKEKKTKTKSNLNRTLGVRVPDELGEFFDRIAERERRDLSEVLRIALEEGASVIKRRGGQLLRAA